MTDVSSTTTHFPEDASLAYLWAFFSISLLSHPFHWHQLCVILFISLFNLQFINTEAANAYIYWTNQKPRTNLKRMKTEMSKWAIEVKYSVHSLRRWRAFNSIYLIYLSLYILFIFISSLISLLSSIIKGCFY